MGVFDDIMASLNELIDDAQGKPGQVVRHKVSIAEVRSYSPQEIKQARLNANMTQYMFATVIGVSKKSVEAWEGGRSKPDGAARRMIGLLIQNPRLADELGIVTR